jgi:hypothetical protein
MLVIAPQTKLTRWGRAYATKEIVLDTTFS